jgi:hypothetical protein
VNVASASRNRPSVPSEYNHFEGCQLCQRADWIGNCDAVAAVMRRRRLEPPRLSRFLSSAGSGNSRTKRSLPGSTLCDIISRMALLSQPLP